jgi:signal transduction histidine kinase
LIFLEKGVLSPLAGLDQAVSEIKRSGDFSRRLSFSRRDELGDLARAIDDLLDKIFQGTSRLSESNAKLEKEIQERKTTERRLLRAKETAELASRSKSDFLANMSHELRTPLNHIIGFTELVVGKQFGDLNDVQTEYLNDVLHSSRHLLGLINDILDLSKVEAGKLELTLEAVNVKVVLDTCLTMIKEKAMKHGIQVSTDVGRMPEAILADERKLKQILYNLLANAVKFTPDGGRICVAARARVNGEFAETVSDALFEEKGSAEVEISVGDNGIGIDPNDFDRIFKPFEQAGTLSECSLQGTGLGLPLTKKLVELHGGRIWVESEGVGKGSKFLFRIPAPVPT